MDGLAQLFRVAQDVEHVVPDLKGKAKGIGEVRGCPELGFASLGGQNAHGAGRHDEGAGLAAVDGQELLAGEGLALSGHVQHLAAHHALLPGALGQRAHNLDAHLRRGVGAGDGGEGRGQKAVAGQHRLGFAIDLVVGEAAAAVVVVVHAGKVVVDEAVGVHHLNGGGKVQGMFPSSAAQAAKFQHQHRPDPLAPGQEAIAHGLKELPLGLGLVGKGGGQPPLHRLLVCGKYSIKRLFHR